MGLSSLRASGRTDGGSVFHGEVAVEAGETEQPDHARPGSPQDESATLSAGRVAGRHERAQGCAVDERSLREVEHDVPIGLQCPRRDAALLRGGGIVDVVLHRHNGGAVELGVSHLYGPP
ncbi:hypothetical protein GCM10009663_37900 [Kitasatospora arboriphila]|uniref:Uncharacterized protein n=1 Tax=Kitasatospora arboriphila TaxID=258052 RepID=A0ABP4E4A7_9ACTN